MTETNMSTTFRNIGIATAWGVVGVNTGCFVHYVTNPGNYVKDVKNPHHRAKLKIVKRIFAFNPILAKEIKGRMTLGHEKFHNAMSRILTDEALDSMARFKAIMKVSYPYRHIAWALGALGVVWLLNSTKKPASN